MTLLHIGILYTSLVVFGVSLLLPGLIEIGKADPGAPGILATSVAGRNQLRALHGMMVGIGIMALWACVNLEQSRILVLALGIIVLVAALARLYSMAVDGIPSTMTLAYLFVELLFGGVFLLMSP